MSSLIGVALVSKDALTPARLLFWYPQLDEDIKLVPPTPGRGEWGTSTRTQTPYAMMPWQTDQRKRDGHGASHGRNIADEADPRDRFAASVGCHSAKVLAHTLIPHANLRGTRFELKIDDYLFVGHPTETAQFSAKSAAAEAGAEGGPAVEDEATLPFVFNLVLILKGRSKPVVVDAYYDLARRISAALVHEETRLGYLTKELKAMVIQPDLAPSTAQLVILGRSELAQTLRKVMSVLSTSRKLQIKVNGWITIAFCSPEEDVTPQVGGVDVSGDSKAMRPFHTLLLNGTNDGLLKRLPSDCSPSLYQFVQLLSPLKTFEELASEICVSLAQVFRLAQHLIAWKEARLIHPIAAPNVYVVSPTFDLAILHSEVAEHFAQSFNTQRLSTVLVRFSQPRAFGEHMAPFAQSKPAVQEQQLLMVQWLLKRNVLTQLHMYFFFSIQTLAQHQMTNKGSRGAAHGVLPNTSDSDETPRPNSESPRGRKGTSQHLTSSPGGRARAASHTSGSSVVIGFDPVPKGSESGSPKRRSIASADLDAMTEERASATQSPANADEEGDVAVGVLPQSPGPNSVFVTPQVSETADDSDATAAPPMTAPSALAPATVEADSLQGVPSEDTEPLAEKADLAGVETLVVDDASPHSESGDGGENEKGSESGDGSGDGDDAAVAVVKGSSPAEEGVAVPESLGTDHSFADSDGRLSAFDASLVSFEDADESFDIVKTTDDSLDASLDEPSLPTAVIVAETDTVDYDARHDELDPLGLLTKEQFAYVLKLPAAEDEIALSRFFQLLPYFGGRHSVDEMMWCENLSRTQILETFHQFRAVLHKVVC